MTLEQPKAEYIPLVDAVKAFESTGEVYCKCPYCNRLEDSLVRVRLQLGEMVTETGGFFTERIKKMPVDAPFSLNYCLGCNSQYMIDFREVVWV